MQPCLSADRVDETKYSGWVRKNINPFIRLVEYNGILTVFLCFETSSMQKQKPIFDKRIFWDVDFNTIDYDKHPNWIIVRVFERGDIADIKQLRRYYGDRIIKNAVKKA